MAKFNFKKPDWTIFAVIIISVLSLYQVHFNYTGKFSMVNDRLFEYHEAKNMKYVYPYFSDEWYAVSLVRQSIKTSSLPLQNPFDGNFFANPEIFFHSFLAVIFFVFHLNPLTHYTLLSIFFNTLIIVLAYLFLRFSNLSKTISAISALSILYITSSANLPGIWNLIPVTAGIIFALAGFCLMAQNARCRTPSTAIIFGILVFLFYPPLTVFYGLGLLVYFLSLPRTKEKLPQIAKFLMIFCTIFVILLIILSLSPAAGAIKYIFSNLFYNSFTGNFIPQFAFYYIIPWWVIVSAIFGLAPVFKNKKWLFYQLVLGIVFWIFYSFSTQRIIIGFERTVFFTSILLALISGFGIEEVKKYLGLKFEKIKPVFKYVEAGIIILFLFFVPFYTQGESWRKLILSNEEIQADSIPMAPANNYLTDEDLRIFKNIKQKKFFSIPWKGTVVGIATDNYPVVTKGGTITMDPKNPIIYQQFMDYDCEKKTQFAKDKNLDYVYSMPFNCPEFEKIDQSSEGFVLYKYAEKN